MADMPREFDAIVIGAGQAGPPLAGRFTDAGQTVAVIERKLVGGTCVNYGCIPTKTLVASAHAAHIARRGSDFGIGTGDVTVDMAKVKARKDRIMLDDRSGLESWLDGMDGCTLIRGHARFEGPNTIRVGDEVLTAPKIFLNVGGRATVPPIPGLTTSTTSPMSASSTSTNCQNTWWSSAAATSRSSSRRCTDVSAPG